MINWLVPVCIAAAIAWGLYKKVDVYSAFVKGASEALNVLIKILPYMAAMLIALNVFRSSGALSWLIKSMMPLLERAGIPAELVPLLVLRPFSGSAALALLQDIFANYGVDSYAGLAASVIVGSTETIFYTIAIYFGAVNITRTRHSIPVALISGIFGAAAALIIANALWR